MKPFAVLFLATTLAAAAGAEAASVSGLAINDPGLKAAKALKVTSSAIRPGGAIPDQFSSYGTSISPPLTWGKGPYGTRSFALLVEDPDAPMAQPFTHWLVWNIPTGTPGAAQGAAPKGAVEGKLMFVGKVGYMGPKPPPGGAHHYHFQVFALDRTLDIPSGTERGPLVAAMQGHVLASGELVATYQKK